jgi:hypothetical protein
MLLYSYYLLRLTFNEYSRVCKNNYFIM